MPPGPPLRFDRATFGSNPEPLPCTFCGRELANSRFEVMGRPACVPCTEQARAHVPQDSRERFLRALAVSCLSALGGALAMTAVLGALPGAVARSWAAYGGALALGWAISRAMRIASGGVGGRRYQVTAALLTYAATVYPLQFFLLGTEGHPWWTYPLLLLRPIAFLFLGLAPIGTWQLLAAFVGMRLAWQMTRGLPAIVLEKAA